MKSKASPTRSFAASSAQVTDDFMIIARIESLILKAGMDDASDPRPGLHRRRRERHYDPQQGANRRRDADLLSSEYAKFDDRVPLVAVPSTYSRTTEDELAEAGVRIVIYANQLLRSRVPRP